ncbi:hypothetical protein FIU86_11440 [Roseovarius sp. THAF9]|nr:hypothetical protein FIU86_11440 [Roseovarius sp. THAF9]
MSRNRIILNVAVAALLLSALLGSWFFQNRSKSVVFRTELGKWSAESVQWQKIGESWRIQTVVTPLTARGVRMQAKDLFHSFCVALMKDLPVVPDPGIAKGDVFRVDLNLTKDRETNEHFVDGFAPIEVRDGRCVLPGEVMSPTYPEPLDKWYLARRGAHRTSDDEIIPSLIFRSREDVSAALNEFPAKTACEFALADPLANLNNDREEYPDLPTEGGPLAVVIRKGLWTKIVTASASLSFVYDTAKGICLERDGADT